MKSLREIFEEFADFGSRTILDAAGFRYEGYILDINADAMLFGCGGPLGKDVWIKLADIDLNTLFFWNEERKCLQKATWNANDSNWRFADFKKYPL